MKTAGIGTIETLGPAPDIGDVQRATIGQDGLSLRILSFGAIVQDIWREGVDHSLVLGFEDVASYFNNPSFVGTVVGRFGNRIAGGRFELANQTYQLDLNENGRTHLHGGCDGVFNRNWTIESVSETKAVLAIRLAHMEMGYPGAVDVRLTYEVLPNQRLQLRFEATCDRQTVINLVPHFYFKLDQCDTISEHLLQVFTDEYLAVDAASIPVGAPLKTTDSPFDFSKPTPLAGPDGCVFLDHNFCYPTLPDSDETNLQDLAVLKSTNSGCTLRIRSSKPGLQIYTGQALGTVKGASFHPYGAIALEPQYWPNSPNMPSYPNTEFGPDRPYKHVHEFDFS